MKLMDALKNEHESMIKEALIGKALKWIAKHPGKSLMGGLNTYFLGTGAGAISEAAQKGGNLGKSLSEISRTMPTV